MLSLTSLLLISLNCINSLRNIHKSTNVLVNHKLHTTISNSDIFGTYSSSENVDGVIKTKDPVIEISKSPTNLIDQAARLRQEAAELEVAMREEARMKGVPEEVINKLMPVRKPTATNSATKSSDGRSAVAIEDEPAKRVVTADIVRDKLGYLQVGEPVAITTALDTLKSKTVLGTWNSFSLGKPDFQSNEFQLKSRSSFEFAKLKLDDVGYDYKLVLLLAIVAGTVLGLSSSSVGGILGFVMGYGSALIPVTLLGVGSIAPGLIGDALYQIKLATDEEARQRFAHISAAKFFAGYALGLPLSRFNIKSNGISNSAEFFQVRPRARKAEDEPVYAKSEVQQIDIAPYSIVCLAGPMAECIAFGVGSGSNPADISTLYNLLTTVRPEMTSDSAKSHVLWSAVKAYELLSANKDAYTRLLTAFKEGKSLEDCICAIEGAV